jgi:sugar (pentulose or hexulose) kinase
MPPRPVIAVIDVGKTNKKLFLFDEEYNLVYERSARFLETVDEDGDTCENIESLRLSVFDSLRSVLIKKSLIYGPSIFRPMVPLLFTSMKMAIP